MRSERWEAIRFLLVIALAAMIATFPFWYPKEKGHVQAGHGWSDDTARGWGRRGGWTARTPNPNEGEHLVRPDQALNPAI